MTSTGQITPFVRRRAITAQPDPTDPANIQPHAPPPQWAEADRDDRCAMIVSTALDLLHTHGSTAVTMRRVAGSLGVGTMTLYTYYPNQLDLHRAMVREGFARMRNRCEASSTLETPAKWRGGAHAYLAFAVENPNLYKLMFDTPAGDDEDQAILRGGFQPLLDRVRDRLAHQGLSDRELDEQARQAAGRFWIALHGLASLAIAGRLAILDQPVHELLDAMLERVSPD